MILILEIRCNYLHGVELFWCWRKSFSFYGKR